MIEKPGNAVYSWHSCRDLAFFIAFAWEKWYIYNRKQLVCVKEKNEELEYMKILLKVLVILSLVSINTACDWLKWNPTYIDEEWVVEKVEYVNGSKFLEIYFKQPQGIQLFVFYGDEELETGFRFSNCSISNSDVVLTKRSVAYTNFIVFDIDKSLNPAIHITMQFDTNRIFYRVIMQGETSLFKPSQIWRCRISTASMDITYVD